MTQATPLGGALSQEPSFRELLAEQRVLAVVRADTIPDVAALCAALADGGIHVVELTFTTPGVDEHLAAAAAFAASGEGAGTVVGAGTVLGAAQARAAVDAGAAFLVTPAVGRFAHEVAEVAREAGVPLMPGALTPSEVVAATELGADVVKIFPASLGGPRHVRDLLGPFPDAALVPSGGVDPDNARAFLDAGALAVSAGTGVVPPDAVESADWARISAAARTFRDSTGAPEPSTSPSTSRETDRERGDR
jgi:2-dehydro-3-deoxyphosphogluconate aldolase/(4S)-4-hydroxy-2-oxoglutarate aldolase